MKTIKEVVRPALDISGDQAMDQLVGLIIKAFPGPKEVAEWISDSLCIIADGFGDEKMRQAALDLIRIITGSLLQEFIEAKTQDDKTDVAWQFIEIVKGDFFKKKDTYLKALEALDEEYMILNCDCDIREARFRIYQFDALKEISKLIKEPAA